MSKMAVVVLCAVTAIGVAICFNAYKANAQESHPAYKYYTSIQVSAGETLWSIADEYMGGEYDSRQEYIQEVVQLNHLKSADVIHEGCYLTVPYYSSEFLE